MAVYAFQCEACGEQFEVNAPMSRVSSFKAYPPACPTCGKTETKRLVSTFSVKPDWRTT